MDIEDILEEFEVGDRVFVQGEGVKLVPDGIYLIKDVDKYDDEATLLVEVVEEDGSLNDWWLNNSSVMGKPRLPNQIIKYLKEAG